MWFFVTIPIIFGLVFGLLSYRQSSAHTFGIAFCAYFLVLMLSDQAQYGLWFEEHGLDGYVIPSLGATIISLLFALLRRTLEQPEE